MQRVLVRLTRPGYKILSRSLSLATRPAEGENEAPDWSIVGLAGGGDRATSEDTDDEGLCDSVPGIGTPLRSSSEDLLLLDATTASNCKVMSTGTRRRGRDQTCTTHFRLKGLLRDLQSLKLVQDLGQYGVRHNWFTIQRRKGRKDEGEKEKGEQVARQTLIYISPRRIGVYVGF